MNSESPRASRSNVERRLLMRLRIYLVIFVVIFVIVVVNIMRGDIGISLAALTLIGGTLVGLVVSRMYRLSWDEEGSAVIARIDWLGAVILVLYIAFAIGRTWLFSTWVQGNALVAVTLGIVAGIMLGRVIGTTRGVRKLLNAAGFR